MGIPHTHVGLGEPERTDKLGGGALMASGLLFAVFAALNFLAGPPPSTGPEVLRWRDAQTLALDFVNEVLFFAAVLLVPGTIGLYRSLADVDNAKAATGCGLIATTIACLVGLLIVHGRLVYPVYDMRVDTPDIAAFAVIVFYGGLHAVSLVFAVATLILSLAMRGSAYARWVAYMGFATSLFDVIGSYPWLIGPTATVVCSLLFSGWFVAVGWQLFGLRRRAA
jgi:hypothetical protein